MTQELIRGSNDVLSYIDFLKIRKNLEAERCSHYFNLANGFLYAALILSIISVGYGFRIYVHYKKDELD